MQSWSAFYAAIVSAAATLLGLLFVAVSINASAVLNQKDDSSRRLAEQAFQNYVSVLTVALIALIPSILLTDLGRVILSVTLLSAVWVLIRFYLTLTRPASGHSKGEAVRHHLASLCGLGMLMFAAARLALNKGDTRNLLAASVLVLLIAATRASWVLLLSLRRARPADSGR